MYLKLITLLYFSLNKIITLSSVMYFEGICAFLFFTIFNLFLICNFPSMFIGFRLSSQFSGIFRDSLIFFQRVCEVKPFITTWKWYILFLLLLLSQAIVEISRDYITCNNVTYWMWKQFWECSCLLSCELSKHVRDLQ